MAGQRWTKGVYMPATMTPNKRYYSPADAAIYTGLSAKTLRRLSAARKIRALKPTPNRLLFDKQDLDRYLRSCTK